MSKLKKHICLTETTWDKIESYRIVNNMNRSESIEKLVKLGLENIIVIDKLEVIERMINDNIKITFSNYSLLKQFYSDMQFTNYTDYKKCELLNKILKNKRLDKYND